MMIELTKENFELYASKQYLNGKWSTTDDFKGDLARFKYINRLINRYYRDDELKERLILNHIIVLGNVFGPAEAAKMMMFCIKKEQRSVLKTFLIYLNYLPEHEWVRTPLDSTIVDTLRKL
jgi:hypothetical protein